MNATTNRKERKPRQRTIGIAHREGEWFLLEISEQKTKTRQQTDYYFARPLPAAFGTGFELEKQDDHGTAATYHVNLHGLDGFHLCDCRGFGSHGHCRHVEGLLALRQAGKLPPAGVLTAQADTFCPVDEMTASVEDARQLRIVAEADDAEAALDDLNFDWDCGWETTDPAA